MSRTGIPRDPVTRFVRSLPGEFFTLNEVAGHLDVSPRSVRRLIGHREDGLGPARTGHLGKVTVYLYTAANVERLQHHFALRRHANPPGKAPIGRPRLWNAAEYADRHARHVRAYHWRHRAAELLERGEFEAAGDAQRNAAEITNGLRAQYRRRVEEVGGW